MTHGVGNIKIITCICLFETSCHALSCVVIVVVLDYDI
jgi:hypothetical protein